MLPVRSCTLFICFYFPLEDFFQCHTGHGIIYGITKVLDWNHVTHHMEGSYSRNGTVIDQEAIRSLDVTLNRRIAILMTSKLCLNTVVQLCHAHA